MSGFDDLEPCPKCGKSDYLTWEGPGLDHCAIRCGLCGVEGPQGEISEATFMWDQMANNRQIEQAFAHLGIFIDLADPIGNASTPVLDVENPQGGAA